MKIDFKLCNKKGTIKTYGINCTYRNMDILLYDFFMNTHKAYEYIMNRGYYLTVHDYSNNDNFTFSGETLFKYYKLFCVCYQDKEEFL